MKVQTAAGSIIDLGTTEAAPTISITDYSKRVTDAFGVTRVVKRDFARRMSVRVAVPTETMDTVQRALSSLRATSALWTADESSAWLTVKGFCKEFEADLAVPPNSFLSLTVQGEAEIEVVPDSGQDPAPPGTVSSLRLLQPFSGSGLLVSSSVPENDHLEWSSGTTYAAGARVIKAATHLVYESVAGGNVGNDPAATTGKWIEVGPTKRWAMFDQALGSATTAAGSITVTLAAGVVNAVALLDVVASTVRVQSADFDETQAVSAGSALFLDLPETTDQVTVTITNSGQVSVGTLIIGKIVPLGVTEASPSAGITDFSRKDVDEFGAVTIVERGFAKRMSARALLQSDAVDVVANRLASARATPSLWIGDSGLDTLTIYGFFKDWSIEVNEGVSKLTLSVEGLSKAPPAPITVDPSNALVGDLTAPAVVVATAADGSGGNYSSAGGSFKVFRGGTDVSNTASYSVVSTTGGLAISIGATTGVYAVTGLTGADGTALLRATIDAETIDLTYSIAKSRSGASGAPGASGKVMILTTNRDRITYSNNTTLDPASQDIQLGMQANGLTSSSFTISATNGAGATINLSTGFGGGRYMTASTGTLQNNGNSLLYEQSNPAATQIIMTAAQFDSARGSSNGIILTLSNATDGVTYRMLISRAVNGQSGDTVDIVFVRSASQPSTPNASPGTPTSPITWYTDAAAANAAGGVGIPLWSSAGKKASTVSNYTWSTPTRVEGESVAEVTAFIRSASPPGSNPTGGSFNMSTKTLTPPSGYSTAPPAGNAPLYMARGIAAGAPGATAITPTWVAVGLVAEHGSSGASNMVFNSEFRFEGDNLFGWESGVTNNTGGTVTRGVNLAGFFGVLNVAYVQAVGSFSGSSTADGHRNTGSYESSFLDRLKKQAAEVTPGERLYVSMAQATQNCAGTPIIVFYDQNGSLLSDSSAAAGYTSSTLNGASGGLPANFTRNGHFFDVPASAAFAAIATRIRPNAGSATARLFYTQMSLQRVRTGDSNPPPYSPGPTTEPSADVTSSIVGPADLSMEFYSTGLVFTPGNGGVVYPFRLKIGDTDVTEQAEWSIVTLYGNHNIGISNTSGSKGRLTVAGVNAPVVGLKIVATLGSRLRVRELTARRKLAPMPMGVVAGAQNAIEIPSVDVTATTEAGATVVSSQMSLTTGTGITFAVAVANLHYTGSGGQSAQSQNVTVKAQIFLGGSWVDMASGTNSGFVSYSSFQNVDGAWVETYGQQIRSFATSGLTQNTTYLVRFLAWISGGTLTSNSKLVGCFQARGDNKTT